MSTTSARRVKERGGRGGRVTPTPAGKVSPVSGRSVSVGKENARATSRARAATQKPILKPMARVDKSAVAVAAPAAEESRSRRSTSSVPRGRSSSPSEVTRVLSDLRKNPSRGYVASSKGKENSVSLKGLGGRRGEKTDLDNIFGKDLGKNGGLLGEVDGGSQRKDKVRIRVVNNGRSDIKEETLGSAKMATSSMETMRKENVAANKYPSKLHEKLAFLEGKVKKIASDIKKTKEILDLNNQDTSKMMLSDIQENITGIEKAMVFVKSGGQNQDVKGEKEARDAKSSVKGLNAEELEARLFPHKLNKDRTSSKSESRGVETRVLEVGESTGTLVVDEKKNTTFEENDIGVELVASLSKEESHVAPEVSKLEEMDDSVTYIAESSSFTVPKGKDVIDALLMADERLNDFDDEENRPAMVSEDEVEENYAYKLNDIGHKTSTGGWFVSEGESVLLAHGDGSCSFYDIANSELKAEYKPPGSVIPNIWQDCWIVRAPTADGCSGRYVVAASAGNPHHSGFCLWDFYTKKIHAYHFEDDTETNHARPALAALPNTAIRGRSLSTAMATENSQWWYRPCGPLIMSGSSYRKMIQIFDIRDGEQVMKWELQKPLSAMDYASPLQWRNRGKVAIAESVSISVWDVSSLSSQALLSVSTSGRKISALHVNNTDAELGGGVRQRVSSAEAEGNDGVFCTSDSINVLDFRLPSGIGLKLPKVGVDVHSAFSRGDSIYIGCSSLRSAAKRQYSSQIQQFSLRKQSLFSTYTLPESNAHSNATALTQVWGSSSYVMGVCGLGLFVFDSLKDEGLPSLAMGHNSSQDMETIGPDDMCSPSFDYSSPRVLLISKDRPAQWRYLF